MLVWNSRLKEVLGEGFTRFLSLVPFRDRDTGSGFKSGLGIGFQSLEASSFRTYGGSGVGA